MSRPIPDKPWFHKASGFWCAQIDGKRIYLSRNERSAQAKLNRKLAQQRSGEVDRDWLEAPFLELVQEFLDDVKNRKSDDAYKTYLYCTNEALKILKKIPVGDLRKIHLVKIEQALRGKMVQPQPRKPRYDKAGNEIPDTRKPRPYSPTTITKVIYSVQRVLNWAVEHELIDRSPIGKYRRPRERSRSRVITADEFARMVAVAKPVFVDVLHVMRATGCRPKEVRTLTWSMVDLDSGLWIIPVHKSTETAEEPRPRVIPLDSMILAICQRLSAAPHTPDDFVFLNTEGRPWTKGALVQQMDGVRHRAGIEIKAGERVVLYSNRHTFGTESVGKISDIELAELMGHSTTRTTKKYVHMNTDRLKDIRRRLGSQEKEGAEAG